MRNRRHPAVVFICLLTIVAVFACHAPPRAPDLGGLYNELAQNEDPYRNPVILIPGILGSKLVDRSSGSIVWGTFGFGNADPKNPSGDSVVLRSSALLDERWPDRQAERLISPIDWEQVFFLFSDHRDITDDPVFTDNLLYILLESPRNG